MHGCMMSFQQHQAMLPQFPLQAAGQGRVYLLILSIRISSRLPAACLAVALSCLAEHGWSATVAENICSFFELPSSFKAIAGLLPPEDM
jgi:hypothetical protein